MKALEYTLMPYTRTSYSAQHRDGHYEEINIEYTAQLIKDGKSIIFRADSEDALTKTLDKFLRD